MDILNEVMEQIRPLNEALVEKARITHALRKLMAEVKASLDDEAAWFDLRSHARLSKAIAEAKEALK